VYPRGNDRLRAATAFVALLLALPASVLGEPRAPASVPRGVESALFFELRDALIAADDARIGGILELHPDLLPQTLEELIVERFDDAAAARALVDIVSRQGAKRTLLAEYAADLERTVAAPDFPARAAQAAALTRRARELWERDDGSDDRAIEAHEHAAAAYHAAGLHALGYVELRWRLDRLADTNRTSAMIAEYERVRSALVDGPYQLARHELRLRYGVALKAEGRLAASDDELTAAWRFGRRRDDSWLAMKAIDELGWLQHQYGRTERALFCFEEFEAIAQRREDPAQIARAYRCRGLQLDELGRIQEGRELLRSSVELALEHELHYRACQNLTYWGSAEVRNGRLLEAGRLLSDAREEREAARAAGVRKRDLAYLDSRIQKLLDELASGEIAPVEIEPLDVFLERLAGRERVEQSRRLERRCRALLEAGRAEEALVLCEAMVQLAQKLFDGGQLTDAYRLTARALSDLGHEDAVRLVLSKALDEAVGLRRRQDSGRPEHRLRSGERLATTLSNVLREMRGDFLRGEGERWSELALAYLMRGHTQALTVWLAPNELSEPDPRELRAQLDRALGDRGMLIAFDFDAGLGVAAHGGALRLLALREREYVEARLGFARTALRERDDPRSYARFGGELGDALLGSVADWLAETDEILCVPDPMLLEWPLGLALAPGRGDVEPEAFADLPFLFRTHAISYLMGPPSSADEPKSSPRSSLRDGRFLTFARAEAEGLEPLPGVAREVRAVKDGLGAERVDSVSGADATEHRFKTLDWSRITGLHVACHVNADPADGLMSALMLAPGGGEDGTTTVAEVARMSISVAFASLAGCGGAREPDWGGAGRQSLGCALLAAGAETVLVSAQEVDDDVSPLVFAPFYRRIGEGRSPAEALRLARIELLDRGTPRDVRALANAYFLMRARP